MGEKPRRIGLSISEGGLSFTGAPAWGSRSVGILDSCVTSKKIQLTRYPSPDVGLARIGCLPANGTSRFYIQCITDSPAAVLALLYGNMDAHLIGIEVTQLLLKLKAPAEKQQPPAKAEKADARTGDFRTPDSRLH